MESAGNLITILGFFSTLFKFKNHPLCWPCRREVFTAWTYLCITLPPWEYLVTQQSLRRKHFCSYDISVNHHKKAAVGEKVHKLFRNCSFHPQIPSCGVNGHRPVPHVGDNDQYLARRIDEHYIYYVCIYLLWKVYKGTSAPAFNLSLFIQQE